MASVLITGGNRGIGLELCRQLQQRGDDVTAAVRSASPALRECGAAIIETIDVSDAASVGRLADAMANQHIDVLINNARILKSETFGDIDYEQMLEQYRVNTLGPLRVTEALADKLSEGSKVIIITSRVGSIDDNTSGGNWGYRASKTAVNQIGRNLMHEFKPRGIAVALLHPGLVATDMTGGRGISAAESATGLIARIDALTLAESGGFWHAEGYRLPW